MKVTKVGWYEPPWVELTTAQRQVVAAILAEQPTWYKGLGRGVRLARLPVGELDLAISHHDDYYGGGRPGGAGIRYGTYQLGFWFWRDPRWTKLSMELDVLFHRRAR